jgi:hypothetical protein
LDMLFKSVRREALKKIIVIFLLAACYMSLVAAAYAEVLERIVAIVNDDIILFSELQSATESDSQVSRDKVLNDMIDNMLLLNEAEKYRISTPDKTNKIETDDRVVVGEYIDRRIKALIHIPYEDIENYYQKNIDLYRDKAIIDVRDAIEEQLVEVELKIKLREHLEELRKKAYIRIQLNEED